MSSGYIVGGRDPSGPLVLELQGGSLSDGTPVVLGFKIPGAEHQLFVLEGVPSGKEFVLLQPRTGFVIECQSISAGAPLTLGKRTGYPTQLWMLDSMSRLVSATNPSLCVGVCGGQLQPGARIELVPLSDEIPEHHVFRFVPFVPQMIPPPAPFQPPPQFVPPYVNIAISVANNLVFDVFGGACRPGVHVVVGNRKQGAEMQLFSLQPRGEAFVIACKTSSLVVSIKGGKVSDGMQLQLDVDQSLASQLWTFLPSGQIASTANPDYVVDVRGGRPEPKKDLVVSPIRIPQVETQSFVLMDHAGLRLPLPVSASLALPVTCVDDAYFYIQTTSPNIVFDVFASSTNAGAHVVLATKKAISSTTTQTWLFQPDGTGAFTIMCGRSGLLLSPPGDSAEVGRQLQLSNDSGSLSQRWTFANGQLVNALNRGACIDIRNSSLKPNADIILSNVKFPPSSSQVFMFVDTRTGAVNFAPPMPVETIVVMTQSPQPPHLPPPQMPGPYSAPMYPYPHPPPPHMHAPVSNPYPPPPHSMPAPPPYYGAPPSQPPYGAPPPSYAPMYPQVPQSG